MKRVLAVLTIVLMLSGCAFAPHRYYPDAGALQQSVANYWVGKPLGAVESRYGAAYDCRHNATATACIWRQRTTREYDYRTTRTVSGQIGDASQYPYNQPVPYTATVSGTRPEYESYECTLEVDADASGTITFTGLTGKMGACAYFQP